MNKDEISTKLKFKNSKTLYNSQNIFRKTINITNIDIF